MIFFTGIHSIGISLRQGYRNQPLKSRKPGWLLYNMQLYYSIKNVPNQPGAGQAHIPPTARKILGKFCYYRKECEDLYTFFCRSEICNGCTTYLPPGSQQHIQAPFSGSKSWFATARFDRFYPEQISGNFFQPAASCCKLPYLLLYINCIQSQI